MENKKTMIRTYTKLKEKNEKISSKIRGYQEYDNLLVFDTETTADEFQNLKFGFFQIYSLGKLKFQGIFYERINITNKEFYVLKNHNQDYIFMTREEFVHEIFYPTVYDNKALCIGFNLFFDLSRLAFRFPTSRKGKTDIQLQLSKYLNFPNIEIDHKGGNLTFIRFGKAFNFHKKKYTKYFAGNFLDLASLSCVFSDRKRISLKDACKLFDTNEKKTEDIKHGKITPKYVDYCVQDVKATYSLYEKLLLEFSKYTIDMDICKVYSSASLAKSALRQLGITPYRKQHRNIPSANIEHWMNAYFGGRCELMYRKKPVKVTVLDFLSMYPTITIIMDLWKMIIAEKIIKKDATQKVKKLLKKVDLNYLQNKDNWKCLTILVKLVPNDDFLPQRCCFKEDSKIPNIALNCIKYDGELYYALPDVIGSVLVTKRIPEILEAIEFIPKGVQKSLRKTKLLGLDIDPREENFIKTIIEKRQKIKDQFEKETNKEKKKYYDGLQKALKILANSLTYGIYVEMNKKDSIKHIFELENFEDESELKTDSYEEEGEYFHPIVAVSEIAGARLFLTMAQLFVEEAGYPHYYTDTDSMFVNPKIAQKLQDFFQPLSPYDFDKPLFKPEKKNLWFYGISSKRYVLYEIIRNKIIIYDKKNERGYKLHGLGHLTDPFCRNKKGHWHKEIWMDILNLHYGRVSETDLTEKYSQYYSISNLTVSTKKLFERFTIYNKDKPLEKQIKPANFFHIGIKANGVKPISPLCDIPQDAPCKPFLDYETGKTLRGEEYWGTLWDLLRDYLNHPESKFDGDIGWLKRKHINITSVEKIGKEINDIDKHIIKTILPNKYLTQKKKEELILNMGEEEAINRGVGRSTLYELKNKIKKEENIKWGSKTIQRLVS